ncbi:metallophosphoesterase [Brevibacillus massiliensis]|uniref:metallophosphoesterase n=1 Tax=Brevibacillus massiliensis TaxID=1118054 RepID=UPI0002EE8E51|nr:metallophosphoesterase [Brevibacillus massiliensis]
MKIQPESGKVTRRRFLKTLKNGVIAMAGACLYSVCIERFWIAIREQVIAFERLPADLDGLRIVHFSDVHAGHYFSPQHLLKVVGQVNGLQPDLICFTGDLFDSRVEDAKEIVSALSKLRSRLGKWAVLGNHDYRSGSEKVAKVLSQAGFQLLQNQHGAAGSLEKALYIAGVDDVLYGKPDLQQALRGIPEGKFTILLAHEPDFADYAGGFPVDLQLSGHSHGGQVRLPFIGPILTPEYGQKYPDGLQKVDSASLLVYTNRGIGTTILPIRFFCRPEITLLTLRSASLAAGRNNL